MTIKTLKLFDLSTAHVSDETRRILDRHPSRWPVYGLSGMHGWMIYVHDERPDDCPDDLWACIERARLEGADYVNFDCDAEAIDGLPTYEW